MQDRYFNKTTLGHSFFSSNLSNRIWRRKSGASLGFVYSKHSENKTCLFLKKTNVCRRDSCHLLQKHAKIERFLNQPTASAKLWLWDEEENHHYLLNLLFKEWVSYAQNSIDSLSPFVWSGLAIFCILLIKLDDQKTKPFSGVASEPVYLYSSGSYFCEIWGHSPRSLTKYIKVEETNAAIINELCKKLPHTNDPFNETELLKSEIEHKEPTTVGCSIWQYAKLRMLELRYIFTTKFCATHIRGQGKW